jgi:ActR/RegA family two-component response regulator
MDPTGKVLVADDDEPIRLLVQRRLREDGLSCDCAASGHEAAGLLHENVYDVLIADIRMEGNTDLALVRAARQTAPSMPVILITGYPALETAIPSIELSVMAYLEKPVEYARIREQVCRAMEHSALHRGINEVRKRLSAAATEFAAIQTRLSSGFEPTELIPISAVRDVSTALSQILRLRAALGCQDGNQSLCRLLDCREHPNYEDAIIEAIDTLQRTKNSFKSKDLGNLRLRLESVLEKPHALPPMHISRATSPGEVNL